MSQEFAELLRVAVRVAAQRQIPHSAHRHTLVTQGVPMKRRRKVIKQGSGCSLSRALHCWAKLTSAHTHTRIRPHTHTKTSYTERAVLRRTDTWTAIVCFFLRSSYLIMRWIIVFTFLIVWDWGREEIYREIKNLLVGSGGAFLNFPWFNAVSCSQHDIRSIQT